MRALSKRFGDDVALHELDLAIEPGELLALTGPSGAGKTTTCRVIAGLEHADSGDVTLGTESMLAAPAQRRGVAYMFESYALYPHFSVRENIEFPLRSPTQRRRYSEPDVARRTDEVLALTEMTQLQYRRPAELSGGQKQRVALCRALAQEPSVYLLDEPISHLDAKLRHTLRGEIRERLVSAAKPAMWCTPDAMEAIAIGDRVAVLAAGKLQQVGTADELYHSPRNVTVASLVGDPPINLLPGRVNRSNGALRFEHPQLSFALPERVAHSVDDRNLRSNLIVGIRPTSIDIGASAPDASEAEIYTVEPFGKYNIVTVTLGSDRLKAKTFDDAPYAAGDRLHISLRVHELALFDGNTGLSLT